MASPLNSLCCKSTCDKDRITGPVRCTGCGEPHRHRPYGFYERYLPDSSEQIKVQRYLCRNPDCSCVTFSILPFPCLRYKRHTLATFAKVAKLAVSHSVGQLARQFKKGWTAMRRMIRASQQVWFCFLDEGRHQLWGPCPCREPARYWTSFTQTLFHATVPGPS